MESRLATRPSLLSPPISHHLHSFRAVSQKQGAGAEKELNVLILRHQYVDVTILDSQKRKNVTPNRHTRANGRQDNHGRKRAEGGESLQQQQSRGRRAATKELSKARGGGNQACPRWRRTQENQVCPR